MGDLVSGLFGGGKTTQKQTSEVDPLMSAMRGSLFNTIGKNQLTDLSSQMYRSAVGGYNPQRYNDLYGRYENISNTGFQPQIQSYIDAITKAGTNEWNQNVMPNVIEKTRGYGQGSVVPESIAKAGQNFYTALSGQMAPTVLGAAEQEARNRIAGTEGMGKTLTSSMMDPGNLASDMMRNLLIYSNLQGGGTTTTTGRTADPVANAVNLALITAGLLPKAGQAASGISGLYNQLFGGGGGVDESVWGNIPLSWESPGIDVGSNVADLWMPSDYWG